MLGSFLKISLRKLYREKLYAIINVAGLAIALASSIILFLYLRDELSYDQHLDQNGRVYRVELENNLNGQLSLSAKTGLSLGWELANGFDEFEAYTSIQKSPIPAYFRLNDVTQRWDNLIAAQGDFFTVLRHDVIYGNPETALDAPQAIAVSQTFAERYFGNTNPVGQTIEDIGRQPRTIQLVFTDLPDNTHLQYDVVVANNSTQFLQREGISRLFMMLNTFSYTYVLARDGFDADNFSSMSETLIDRLAPEQFRSRPEVSQAQFRLRPLSEIHFNNDAVNDEPTGNSTGIYAFMAVALFIPLIACINYMNLATARAISRSGEVGMRKILGASQGKLILQFLVETFCYVFLATLFAVLLVEILLKATMLTQLFGMRLNLDPVSEPELLLPLTLLTLCLTFLAGLYPAFYLSSWAPLSALVHSGRSAGRGNVLFRQILFLLQVGLSIAVIATTLLASGQIRYLLNADPGYDTQNLINIPLNPDLSRVLPTVKAELLQADGVIAVSSHAFNRGSSSFATTLPIGDEEVSTISFIQSAADENYIDMMGIALLSGRNFASDVAVDADHILVNESMVNMMGWENPLLENVIGRDVIGVVEDFNFESPRNPVAPLMIVREQTFDNGATNTSMLTVRVSGTMLPQTLSEIERIITSFDPARPFEYQFMDDWYDQFFQPEERQLALIASFACISIFISMLGLYGLTAYSTEQRKKEISLRKVLGASASQIIFLLLKNILWLVLAGAVIGSLAAYLMINEWLVGFAYRITPTVFPFIIATTSVLVLAALIVALQSYKTASSDPVDALQHE